MFDAGLVARLQKAAGRAGVIAVVLQRVRHRFGHDGVGGEMHDGIDLAITQYAAYRFAITGVGNDQLALQDGAAKAGREIVEDHDALALFAKLTSHVTADITRAADY